MSGLWSVALRGALDAFASIGLDAERIRREAHIDPTQLADPDARIPLVASGAIWPAAAAQWGRPGLGLWAGSALSFGKLEALDYGLATASTVGEALARMTRYADVVTAGATGFALVGGQRGEPARFELRGYGMPDLRDYALAVSVRRIGILGVTPAAVTIAGPPVVSRREYEAQLGCAVELESEGTAVRLPDGALEQVVPQRYPGLRATVEREMARLLELARASGDPLAEVRREVTTLLGPVPPTIDAVAARLGLSRRQLQRRLAQHETSFTRVVEESRRSLAELYVDEGRLGVAEIAYLLGYSEPSAFSRAFKRWTGSSPDHRRARS
jgi:AraC-like DNA-binding protein